jgi:hypothetical protein
MAKLSDLTSVLRSKNAGALLCTLDIMFEEESTYHKVRDSGVLTPGYIAELYGLSDNEVSIIPYDVAYAIKITIPRLHKSGDPDDSDIYGAQQHAPLLDIDIPD